MVANSSVYIAAENYLFILGLGGTPQPAVAPETRVGSAPRVPPVTISMAPSPPRGKVIIKLRLRTGNFVTVDNDKAQEADRSVAPTLAEPRC